ncbi:MAG TPA: outer membrane lipoprotein carrier protein LolA [Rhizomicrobium sp.]|jgi:hypothetical protein|nr:outer membrane lipoprotein carrier protein LolA [Rhizomicrobium sp.]
MAFTPFFAPGALLGLALLANSPVVAQPSAAEPLTTGEILRGRFILERHLAGFDKPLRSEGIFSLIPRHGLIWHAQKPFETTTVITTAGISVRANGQETMRLLASRLPGIDHLYEVLEDAVSGNIGALQEDFSVTSSSDAKGWHLVLTPRHPNLPATSQIGHLTITGGRFVEQVDIERTGGDVDDLTFLDQAEQPGPPTADENALLGAWRK